MSIEPPTFDMRSLPLLLHIQCKVIPFTEHLNFHMVAIVGGTVELFDVQGHLRDEYCRLCTRSLKGRIL